MRVVYQNKTTPELTEVKMLMAGDEGLYNLNPDYPLFIMNVNSVSVYV